MHQPDKERTPPGQHHEGHWTMPADLSYPTCNHLSSLFRLLWTFLQSSVENSICLVLFGVLEKKSVGHRVKIGPKRTGKWRTSCLPGSSVCGAGPVCPDRRLQCQTAFLSHEPVSPQQNPSCPTPGISYC